MIHEGNTFTVDVSEPKEDYTMTRTAISIAVAFLFLASSAHAEIYSSPALDVTTKQVIIFKDGYCMFIKEAVGRTDAGARSVIEGIPEAMVLGSFWVVPKNGKLVSVVAKQHIVSRGGRQETQKALLVEFDPSMAGQEVELTLLYFGPGIRWIPTYRIALDNNDKARMVMQAEILNEAENLTGVDVDLVVGVPNFRFKDVVSPMSLEATLRNTLQQAAPQLMSQSMSNILLSQQVAEIRPIAGGGEPSTDANVPAIPSELTAGGSQDLFLYRVPRLTLQAGERAAIPLVSASIPFRHIYTWDVRLTRSGSEAVPGRGKHASPVKLLKNEVWHQIEATNNTNVPWTTGAAMIMDGFLPIAQELLAYTSIGGKCQIPLTVAVDVRGTYSEEEIGRDLNALRFDGRDYVQISKKGTLQVTNHKSEPVALLISCEFGGNATKASDEGKITVSDFSHGDWTDFRGDSALTGHTTINWDLELKAGETKEVTCEYFYYTR